MNEYDVPPDATVYECPYCGAPFPKERSRTLHEGLEHADRLDDAEREAVEAAAEAEFDDIRRFRLIALGALVAIYFGFLFVYAAV